MALELGVEDSGSVPLAALIKRSVHVRDKEDVPHEAALPDFYGLRRGFTVSEFLAHVEREHALRKELSELISLSTDMVCVEYDEVFGLLLIHTKAKRPSSRGYEVEYLDAIMSDQMGVEGHALMMRIEAMEADDVNAAELEVASFDRPHPQLDGSKSFKIIRYARYVIEHRDAAEKR